MITGNEQFHPVVFPGLVYGDGSNEPASIQEGITIRQHFAAMAMQGILSSWDNQSLPSEVSIKGIAEKSIVMADALIAELNKTKAL